MLSQCGDTKYSLHDHDFTTAEHESVRYCGGLHPIDKRGLSGS
jgi:hypothetical protein